MSTQQTGEETFTPFTTLYQHGDKVYQFGWRDIAGVDVQIGARNNLAVLRKTTPHTTDEQTSILTIEISQAACAAIWAAKTHHGEKPINKTSVQMVEEVLEEYALAFLSYYHRHEADVERLINLWRKERDKKP